MKAVNYIKNNPIKSTAFLVGGIYVLREIFKTASNKDTADQVDQELDQSGLSLTYAISNYSLMADQLQSAMFDAGTDEDTIYQVMQKLKNPKDLLQLIKSFGLRTYYQFGWPQGNYNLGQWFQEELTSGEKDKVNQILSANGINYAF